MQCWLPVCSRHVSHSLGECYKHYEDGLFPALSKPGVSCEQAGGYDAKQLTKREAKRPKGLVDIIFATILGLEQKMQQAPSSTAQCTVPGGEWGVVERLEERN